MPKISFLVSSYDGGHFLSGHLDNILNQQTEKDVEAVVVVPDSPGTDSIIAEQWSLKDSRVNYIYVPYRETYLESWCRAWRAAKSPIVVNSNVDDFHAEKFAEIFVRTMIPRKQNIVFYYAGMTVIKNGQVVGRGLREPFDKERYSYQCETGPQVAWYTDLQDSVNWDLINKRAKEYTSAADYWLFSYFVSLGYNGYAIPELLTIYNQRDNSVEWSNKWKNNWEAYATISEFNPRHFQNKLKHAKEFSDFNNLPPKEEWVDCMQKGKKWKI